MSDQLKKAVIGAVVAVALAAAVSYGLISQQTADKLQSDANQALTDNQPAPPAAPPQSAPSAPAPQNSGNQPPAPAEPQPQNPAPRP